MFCLEKQRISFQKFQFRFIFGDHDVILKLPLTNFFSKISAIFSQFNFPSPNYDVIYNKFKFSSMFKVITEAFSLILPSRSFQNQFILNLNTKPLQNLTPHNIFRDHRGLKIKWTGKYFAYYVFLALRREREREKQREMLNTWGPNNWRIKFYRRIIRGFKWQLFCTRIFYF